MIEHPSQNDISVVIPCFNGQVWVERAIDSVLDQKGVQSQVIVIDDGSTDSSREAIARYGGQLTTEFTDNRGACAARNSGLSVTRAPYVMFLDADDYLEGPFLASAVTAMRTTQADLAFGVCLAEFNEHRRYRYQPPPPGPARQTVEYLLQTAFIPPCATVWRTDFLRRLGGWSEGLRRNQDFELVFRALARQPVVAAVAEGSGIYVQHQSGVRISSRQDMETARQQVAVLREMGQHLEDAGFSPDEAKALRLRKAYQLWRNFSRYEEPQAAAEAKRLYLELGGRGHLGNRRHIAAAALLGLRRKERLALKIARALRGRPQKVNTTA